MSDLTGKFTGFEGQISDNHTEVMAALASIIDSLGGVPTSPTTTLDDVATLLTNINSNLVNMRAADALFYAATNSLLDQIATNTDTIITNNALNAQRLLTLLLQTACPCDDTVPLLPPPLSTLPTELANDAKCQRIQYFLDLFSSWVILCTVYLNDNGSISSFQVNNLLSGVLLSVDIVDSELNAIPTSTRDYITTALNGVDSRSAANAAVIDALNSGTVLADMRQALYANDNAADGSNAAKNAIDMSGGPYAYIISAMFYSGWPNVMYGDTPVVDASGYDGTICAPDEPVVLTESCGTLFGQVVGGSTSSGNYGITSYTHLKFGVSGAGGGTVAFYVDDVLRANVTVIDGGNTQTWIGTGTNVRFVCATALDVYVNIQACTGTYG